MLAEKGTVTRPNAEQWQRVKQRLKTELGDDVFSSWFARVEFEDADTSSVYLSVPTRFLKSWIASHYGDELLALWNEERNGVARIELIVRGATRIKAAPKEDERTEAPVVALAAAGDGSGDRRRRSGGPTTTADCPARRSTRATPSTRSARARPTASPSPRRRRWRNRRPDARRSFNPLYIHAGVGRGKTHLLHAITRAARMANPGRNVVYLTAEHFMFRFVAALRNHSAIAFKEALRDIDLLLIDDMQFLQGKSVQQEFCHMLNQLIDGARQVVVAADRPPAELETLDERVRSRLRGGVAFEIGAPDFQLRRDILKARYIDRAGAEPRPRRAGDDPRVRRAVGGFQRPRPGRRAQPPGGAVAVHPPAGDDHVGGDHAARSGRRARAAPRPDRGHPAGGVAALQRVEVGPALGAAHAHDRAAAADRHVPRQGADAALAARDRPALRRARPHDRAARGAQDRGHDRGRRAF